MSADKQMMTDRPTRTNNSQRISIFLPSLEGGGAERVMCNLAIEIAERGIPVDLVLAKKIGPYLQDVPPTVRLIDLGSGRLIFCIPKLINYLRSVKPHCLISALSNANVIAIVSHLLAASPAKIIVSERVAINQAQIHIHSLRRRLVPILIRLFYKRADHIVAISHGVADQLATMLGIPHDNIAVIYNPVVNDKLLQKAEEPVNHPWFLPAAPPVIVAAGRLVKQKDFQTLIRAFSLVRKTRVASLMILGEGECRPEVQNLAQQLGIADDVSLPGFVDNPYKYMKGARAFVLSSLYEGFANVIIEAMACGTPIISTNCPSGPSEILENGRWGRLVPVGDVGGLAKAIQNVLDEVSHPDVKSRAAMFSVEKKTDDWFKIVRGEPRRNV